MLVTSHRFAQAVQARHDVAVVVVVVLLTPPPSIQPTRAGPSVGLRPRLASNVPRSSTAQSSLACLAGIGRICVRPRLCPTRLIHPRGWPSPELNIEPEPKALGSLSAACSCQRHGCQAGGQAGGYCTTNSLAPTGLDLATSSPSCGFFLHGNLLGLPRS